MSPDWIAGADAAPPTDGQGGTREEGDVTQASGVNIEVTRLVLTK